MNILSSIIHKFTRHRSENDLSPSNPPAGVKAVSPAELNQLFSLFNGGRFLEMENVARALVEQYPDSGDCWKGLSVALQMQGKNAIVALQKAADLLPNDAEVYNNLGSALRDALQLDRASANFRRAIEIHPESAVAYCNAGLVCRDLGNPSEAIAHYNLAIQINPNYAEAHANMGDVLADMGQLDRAVASYSRALDIRPEFAQVLSQLGNTLRELGQIDAALAMCRRAIAIAPYLAEAHNNLGAALLNSHQFDDAFICFQRAIQINPDLTEGRWNLSLLLLSQGRYTEAWPLYESRNDPRKNKGNIAPALPYDQWRGEPLNGKSLLLWPEQGYGDYIQFVRFANVLKDRGLSRLTVFCTTPLADLLASVDGVDAVVTDATSIPLHDYWSFPMSIPLHVGTTLENIPSTSPYLRALPQWLARWKNQLPASGRTVGLVWKGSALNRNDAQRSLPGLQTLAPLWSIPDITFISLQQELGEEDAKQVSVDTPLIALGAEIKDFTDTAAIVAQLDLVICVDTAIAHLAGAMGKECWVLLPMLGTDWRWLHDRSDSPWYPRRLRLFRQLKPGDWNTVISNVVTALAEWNNT